MQLISTDTKLFFNFLKTFFAHENITKLPSIYGPGWNFQYCQLAPNQVKSHILFHKNGKPRDLCVVLWLKYFSSLGDRFDALSVKFTHSQLKFIWRIKNILKPSQNKKGQKIYTIFGVARKSFSPSYFVKVWQSDIRFQFPN